MNKILRDLVCKRIHYLNTVKLVKQFILEFFRYAVTHLHAHFIATSKYRYEYFFLESCAATQKRRSCYYAHRRLLSMVILIALLFTCHAICISFKIPIAGDDSLLKSREQSNTGNLLLRKS